MAFNWKDAVPGVRLVQGIGNVFKNAGKGIKQAWDWSGDKLRQANNWITKDGALEQLKDRITGQQQLDENEVARQFEHDEAQIARDWQAEQTEIAREYDSIGSQMERAYAAGVNPISIQMGQSNFNAGASGGAPTGAQASGGAPNAIGGLDPFAMLSSAGSFVNQLAQGRLARAKSTTEDMFREIDFDTKSKNLELMCKSLDGLELDNESKRIMNHFLPLMQMTDLEYKKVMKEQGIVQTANIKKATEILDFQLTETMPAELTKMASERDVNLKNVERMTAEIQKMGKEMKLADLQAIYQDTMNDLAGNQLTESDLRTRWITDNTQGYLSALDAGIQTAVNEGKLSQKEANAFWVKTISGSIRDVGAGVGAALGGVGNAVGGFLKALTSNKGTNTTTTTTNYNAKGNVTSSSTTHHYSE